MERDMAKDAKPIKAEAKVKPDAKAEAKPEAKKPAPLAERIRAAVLAREKAITAGDPKARKAAKAVVEAFRTKANLVLVDEIERAVKAAKA